MKVHIRWPIIHLLITIYFGALWAWEVSAIPLYGEAEPLFPIVAALGRELSALEADEVTPNVVVDTIRSDQYDKIRPYGLTFPNRPEVIVSIRINRKYNFDIHKDGRVLWFQRKGTLK